MVEHQPPAVEGWAIVELLGHKTLAGRVSEQPIAGASLLRIDVPETPEDTRWSQVYAATAAYTKLVGVGSIYAITPCTEEVARRAARELERGNDPIPVTLPPQRQLVPATAAAEEQPAAEDQRDYGWADDDEEEDEDDLPL